MYLTEHDRRYLQSIFPHIDGFCSVDSAAFTLFMSNWASGYAVERGIATELSAGALEIGVWKGKYLSSLYQATQEHSVPVVGVDLFEWGPTATDVTQAFERHFGSSTRLQLVTRDSNELSPSDYLSYCPDRYRIVSVDGEHSAPAVLSDLQNAEAVVSQLGLICIDDFLYPHASAVTDGVYQFFSSPRAVTPFAYCTNKLFLIRNEFADAAYAAASRFPSVGSGFDSLQRHDGAPEWRSRQTVLGRPIITYSHQG